MVAQPLPLTGSQTHVVATLGADLKIIKQLLLVEDLATGRTFDPHIIRDLGFAIACGRGKTFGTTPKKLFHRSLLVQTRRYYSISRAWPAPPALPPQAFFYTLTVPSPINCCYTGRFALAQ